MSGSVGQFTTVDDSDDAGWYVRFMDTSNAQPEYGAIRRSLIEKLGPLAGQEVLDVGSGTGDDTRELAELLGPSGRVVGVDVSAAMLGVARVKLVRQHSPDVDTADDELVRVLRPGGRLAVFDFDAETCTLDHPDRTATRAFLRYWVDHHHRQGWSGRQLRRRFTEKGLTDVTVTPHTVLPSYELFRTVMAGPLTEAVAAGAVDVSPDEWWAPLASAAEAGHFFGSMTGFALGATR